jgi:hypothetical protein
MPTLAEIPEMLERPVEEGMSKAEGTVAIAETLITGVDSWDVNSSKNNNRSIDASNSRDYENSGAQGTPTVTSESTATAEATGTICAAHHQGRHSNNRNVSSSRDTSNSSRDTSNNRIASNILQSGGLKCRLFTIKKIWKYLFSKVR